MRKYLFAILALLAVAGAAAPPVGRIVIPLAADYDLDNAGSYVYIRTVGEAMNPLGQAKARPVSVKTSGASTSITASSAGTNPFLFNPAPPTGGGGDILFFKFVAQPGTGANTNERTESRVILTRADADNVTVDTNIDITGGTTFSYRSLQAGTGATDGWIPVNGFSLVTFAWQIKQSDGTSIDVKVECEDFTSEFNPHSSQNQAFTKNYTAYGCPANACESFTLYPVNKDRCRLAFKINTDTSDAGGNLEKISAQFVGQR